MLFLIPTPIGTLSDITYRAVETLKKCDYILCEDTRTSRALLKHYDIDVPLKSYHMFNEKGRLAEVTHDLETNHTIGLISDAGTPGICDPGAILVKECQERSLPITSLPGPCALTTAFSLFGSTQPHFQFVGFIPKKAGDVKKILLSMLFYDGPSIAYVSPHMLKKVLEMLEALSPETEIFLARELTKKFEETVRGTAKELLTHTPRGEYVLIFEGKAPTFDALTPREHIEKLMRDYSLDRKEAITIAANLRNVSKKTLYHL